MPRYREIGNFKDGLASFITKDDKIGFIDTQGNEVIKAQYEHIYYGNHYSFNEGLASVRKSNLEGFIDTKGNEIIPLQFDYVGEFSEGVATVSIDGEYGYITNPLLSPVTEDIASDWAKPEIDEAVMLKLIPNDMQNRYTQDINRGAFCKLVLNLLEIKTGKTVDSLLVDRGKKIDVNIFDDTTNDAILTAYALGIVSGKGNSKFDPYGSITRQEAAVMLLRSAKILGMKGNNSSMIFADSTDIASWAKDAIAVVSTTKDKSNQTSIMGDTGDNKFSPNASYTRQQAFITMKRMFNAS